MCCRGSRQPQHLISCAARPQNAALESGGTRSLTQQGQLGAECAWSGIGNYEWETGNHELNDSTNCLSFIIS